MELLPCFGIVIGIALLIFWIVELFDLMGKRDDEFPGRYDKVLWFIVIFFGFALGALIFVLWKSRQAAERTAEQTAACVGRILEQAQDKTTPPDAPT